MWRGLKKAWFWICDLHMPLSREWRAIAGEPRLGDQLLQRWQEDKSHKVLGEKLHVYYFTLKEHSVTFSWMACEGNRRDFTFLVVSKGVTLKGLALSSTRFDRHRSVHLFAEYKGIAWRPWKWTLNYCFRLQRIQLRLYGYVQRWEVKKKKEKKFITVL